ncbi:hypothetical protein DPMN_181823 [Dreissena polymorpha]|uniref:Uncharacterized protein n=1 Tax=Dreissena polymorpha TaxID=45954 RepID=A0A9D4I4S2_DREPO|nr:hypothetical protein DPMN_181823 [Dreissena polymorpha]
MTSERPGSHVFQQTRTNFIHIQDIIYTNILTKTYAPPPGCHVFKATKTIFEHIQDIIGTNLLTKFHEDRKINVASRVLTRKMPRPWRPYIIGMNLLTKFHEDRTINVASRLKNALPPGCHVFKATQTIFELIQDIIGKNFLTRFNEDWKINVASRVVTRFYYSHIRKNAPPPGGHVFQPTGIILKLVQGIIGMNLLTKFHEDQTIMWPLDHIKKNAPPLGSHELIQDIIETKFHEDWKINVASRV